jgi:hypothetical protein
MLNQDFSEFVESLNANGVRYLVVGGYAVAVHGHPRYTKDLDIWIEPEAANTERMIKALDAFGFASLGITAADFLVPDQIVQLGYPPARIDLLTSVPGVDFATCYLRRIQVTLGSVVADVIDLDGLRQAKAASGRPQDLADLDALD